MESSGRIYGAPIIRLGIGPELHLEVHSFLINADDLLGFFIVTRVSQRPDGQRGVVETGAFANE